MAEPSKAAMDAAGIVMKLSRSSAPDTEQRKYEVSLAAEQIQYAIDADNAKLREFVDHVLTGYTFCETTQEILSVHVLKSKLYEARALWEEK